MNPSEQRPPNETKETLSTEQIEIKRILDAAVGGEILEVDALEQLTPFIRQAESSDSTFYTWMLLQMNEPQDPENPFGPKLISRTLYKGIHAILSNDQASSAAAKNADADIKKRFSK